ncbi:MAG TPA: glycosyltransferase family 4 protein [Nitrospira sp.]|nr:glycosyltransferase family 4 protein [Nitrospira sp.]HQV11079.1 glycosyltransferase family 4 protein [Nitrospira sp.]
MRKLPHVCILTSQYFDWGIYGGFGSMSRKLAESLVRAGHQVSVIVPGRQGQQPTETIGGVEIRSFSPRNVMDACRLIRASHADIFHSQDPTVLTYLAQRIHPRRAHLVTSRDPRELSDWWVEFLYATPMRRLLTPLNYLTESGLLVRQAVRRADAVYCPAHFLKEKVKRLYGLKQLPTLLPNLIDVPAAVPRKSERPTITFVARWDKRKRPWLFLELAAQFPDYRFVAVGKGSASAETGFDAELRQRFRDVSNLEMPGLINRFREPERMHQLLSDTWIFVSTAVREGLPLTFLEAAAYGCPIISRVDPDQFATRFGKQVHDDDYAAAIRSLLAEAPLEKGRAAYHYVRETYETSRALAIHQEQYARFAA